MISMFFHWGSSLISLISLLVYGLIAGPDSPPFSVGSVLEKCSVFYPACIIYSISSGRVCGLTLAIHHSLSVD